MISLNRQQAIVNFRKPELIYDLIPSYLDTCTQVLPEAERQRYEKISKEYKAKMRGAEGDKYRLDTAGNLLSVSRLLG